MPSFEEYISEIKELWDTRWLTNMGDKHKQLEKALESYLGVENVTLFANGHLALEGILAAYDFPEGAEVITTPFTFVSTVNAIERCRLKPVFCDIDRDSLTIDADKIESLITDKTCAVLPVHVYGSVCDTEEIDRIAKKHGLKVIYDAAHAFGIKCGGRGIASYGDASMFSFHATKVFHTVEGGAVCCGDSTIAEKLSVMKNFGLSDNGDCVYAGGNAKMSEFHAAMGICNLRHIDEEIQKRKTVVLRYRERLADICGITLLSEKEGVEQNYAYMPVIFDGYKASRDEIHNKLKDYSILSRKYFYPAVNEMSIYSSYFGMTPVAKEISEKVLCLPLYADLEYSDVDEICDIILNF